MPWPITTLVTILLIMGVVVLGLLSALLYLKLREVRRVEVSRQKVIEQRRRSLPP